MSLIFIIKAKLSSVELRSNDLAGFQESTSLLIKHINSIVKFPRVALKALDKVNEFRNFAERDPEAPYVVDSCRPSAQWPPNGKVEFRDFSMKYGADLGYALKHINLAINPGEKVGIVGRTGAGKSSLAKVLFRLIHENTSGSILIDGQDISEFVVGYYRPRLGMIPQESSMFGGSVRRNLDPLQQFYIEEMWASLIKCNMAKCLIRKEFSNCTVLTIAHRLETIMKSDRIIVMDKGTIAEIGTPQELLAKDGMFAQLVKTSDFGQ
ncbi:Multidrug resistance-associated protein 1 [Coemansia sp. RSA 2050]|nr:Multidrug resistance-associated protein 1 [Coemansia sp. RSA 2050]